MPRIMTTCPDTNQEVPTGLTTPSPEALAAGPPDGAAFRCSECGRAHAWLKQEAWAEGSARRARLKP
jgi:hypothetical protein